MSPAFDELNDDQVHQISNGCGPQIDGAVLPIDRVFEPA